MPQWVGLGAPLSWPWWCPVQFWCKLCRSHEEKIKAVRNYSNVFVLGISRYSLKRDNCIKHGGTGMHQHASRLSKKEMIHALLIVAFIFASHFYHIANQITIWLALFANQFFPLISITAFITVSSRSRPFAKFWSRSRTNGSRLQHWNRLMFGFAEQFDF